MSTIWICGVDEVGRGPLVGAVVAGAVVLDPQQPIIGLKDSKKLSPAKRETLYTEIMSKSKAWGIGEASPQEIDQFNILQATMLAMQRAIQSLVDQMGEWPGEALIALHYPSQRAQLFKGMQKNRPSQQHPSLPRCIVIDKCKFCICNFLSMALISIWVIPPRLTLQL